MSRLVISRDLEERPQELAGTPQLMSPHDENKEVRACMHSALLRRCEQSCERDKRKSWVPSPSLPSLCVSSMTAARDAADRLLAESLRAERERADKIYEAQEALQREENRLEAAQRQKRVVDKRAAELWRELLAHQQDDQLHEEGLKISEKDEIELAQEFKRALDHVLIHARHPTTTVHEEPAEVVGRLVVEEKEQAAEEQAEDEGEGESRSESESEEDDGGAGPGEKDIKTVEWVRVAWRHLKRNSSGTPREEETVVTVRVHDTYTFADLKGDVCRHLNLAHRFDSMELYHNQREQ